MGRSLRQSLVSLLCLLCFGLSSTVLYGELVLCQHADGSSEIEWGACAPGSTGDCAVGCADSTDSDVKSPKPCKDTPIKNDRHIAKRAPSPAPQPTWQSPAILTILTPALKIEPIRAPASPLTSRGRPPDGLARLRTVVLLV